MKLSLYQIDAFTSEVFKGNPAAVVPLDVWIADELMQKIAAENNLSETAFFVPEGNGYRLRWFTPVAEVDMCGHATLASAYVLFECLGYEKETIIFETESGRLEVSRGSNGYTMDFPLQPLQRCDISKQIEVAFGMKPIETFASMDYVVVFEDEATVKNAKPNIPLLKELDLRGVCITAKGSDADFVLRFFAPNIGVDEDPVTGSALTLVAGYWAEVLKKETLSVKQLSQRGGEAVCHLNGDRIGISGSAVKYLEGVITLKREV